MTANSSADEPPTSPDAMFEMADLLKQLRRDYSELTAVWRPAGWEIQSTNGQVVALVFHTPQRAVAEDLATAISLLPKVDYIFNAGRLEPLAATLNHLVHSWSRLVERLAPESLYPAINQCVERAWAVIDELKRQLS